MAWFIVLGIIILALIYVFFNYFRIKKMDEGTADMSEMAKIIRDGVKALGCRLLLEEDLAANTVTSVFLPAGIGAQDFIDEMIKRGYTFYIGKGDYGKQGMIQIANMGEIYEQDCYNMLEVFEVVLNKMLKK